mgnify:CR=1 FL=1
MDKIIHTYAQVEKIIPIHRLLNIPLFNLDNIEESTYYKGLSDIEKLIKPTPVIKDSTNVNSISADHQTLTSNNKRYKKILSVPAISVSIPIYNSKNYIKVVCYPWMDTAFFVPKKGEWIHIIGIRMDLLNLSNVLNYDKNYIYYYIPNENYKKTDLGLSPNYTDKDESSGLIGNGARNILWPRSGSTLLQNKNGKSYIQIDSNDVLMSTGFVDFNDKNINILNSSYHEFVRYNPISQNDSIIYMSSYDKEWEELLINYYKKLYELQDIDTNKLDKMISDLKNNKNFEERIKTLFNVDFSSRPKFEFGESNVEEVESQKDNGVVIAAKNIFLSTSPNKKQVRYTAARSERIIDLISGLIDYIEDLHKLISDSNEAGIAHTHLYTPSVAVLTPDPGTVSKIVQVNAGIQQLNTKLDQLKSKLNSISTKNIFLP